MRLVTHLLVADLRRFRSTLISWVALVVITTALEGAAPELVPNSGLALGASVASGLLSVATILYFVALIAVVVQNHTVVGTTAFWFARPIPPLSLLVSKAVLLVGVLAVVPIAGDMVLMAVNHVPVFRMIPVVLQSFLIRTLAIAMVMCIAATTANLTRFTLVCVAALVGIGVVGASSLSLLLGQWSGGGRRFLLSTPQGGGPIDIVSRTFDHTPDAIGILFVTTAAVVMLRSQYVSRYVRRSVGIGVAGLFIAIGVAAMWPWPIFVPRQSVPEWANDPRAATLAGDPSAFRFDWSGIRNADDLHMAPHRRERDRGSGWVVCHRAAGWSFARRPRTSGPGEFAVRSRRLPCATERVEPAHARSETCAGREPG